MATPSATPPRLPPLPVLTNNVLHGPSSSIPEGHNTTCPSSFFPVFVGAGCDVPEHKLQLGFSPARLFSLLSLLPLFLSVNSAFSVCSALSLFFLVSPLVTRHSFTPGGSGRLLRALCVKSLFPALSPLCELCVLCVLCVKSFLSCLATRHSPLVYPGRVGASSPRPLC